MFTEIWGMTSQIPLSSNFFILFSVLKSNISDTVFLVSHNLNIHEEGNDLIKFGKKLVFPGSDTFTTLQVKESSI